MLARLTAELPNNPSVLVIGCGTSNELYTELFSSGRVFLTDVTLQGDAEVVCDGGCLPFRDQSLDCVIADQVLEHVLYPAAVVAEIYRCLRPEGLVYSGVPFHTPVHGFPYDFQRYTPLGHRMLFNRFQELELLITQGPVSAFSLSLIGLLACISSSIWWRRFSSFGVRLIVKPLLWIDKRQRTVRNLTIPAASAFLGRKQVGEVTPNEVIRNWIDEGAKGLIENRELGPLSTLSSTR
jgi:SAM-dependent methyltransferase